MDKVLFLETKENCPNIKCSKGAIHIIQTISPYMIWVLSSSQKLEIYTTGTVSCIVWYITITM